MEKAQTADPVSICSEVYHMSRICACFYLVLLYMCSLKMLEHSLYCTCKLSCVISLLQSPPPLLSALECFPVRNGSLWKDAWFHEVSKSILLLLCRYVLFSCFLRCFQKQLYDHKVALLQLIEELSGVEKCEIFHAIIIISPSCYDNADV